MRFQHVIEAVYTQPWAITPAGWRAVHGIVRPHINGKLPETPRAEADTDIFGDPIPSMEINPRGTAIIPIQGTLIQHAGVLEKMCGACSYDDIVRDITLARETNGVKRILFDIASPGGMAVGNQEVCDLVNETREDGVECHAFADSQICSAAFNIAAGCNGIYITSSCFAGSIGCLMAILDESEAFAEAGLKVEMFASGKYKGAGTEGTALTEEQREYFQGLSDAFADMFKNNVRANRSGIPEESMEGQVFVGQQGIDAGVVDELVTDIEEVLEMIQ